MIALRQVSRRYGNHLALDDLSLLIPSGRTTALLGPSGCGKSTLLRMIVGLILPDRGEVLLDQTPLTPGNTMAWRRAIGYVLQEGGLFPHLTASDNLALMPKVLGWPGPKTRSRMLELAELTRFPEEALARYPLELSGGQRQRVSLMRGLMLDPSILLLDEPLGALDPMIRRDLQSDLKRIFTRLAKTVVLVTHDVGEAGFLGDSIVLMKEGRVLQEGSLQDLVERPADPFVTRFINAQRSPLEGIGR